MNEKTQFLPSLMDKRLSFARKRCGFESSSISFFFLFNLLVCSSLFQKKIRARSDLLLNISLAGGQSLK